VNAKLPRLLAAHMFHKRRRQPTILLGSPSKISSISKWLENKSPYGLDIIGIVTDDKSPTDSSPWPVLGSVANLEEILTQTGASQVIAMRLPNSISRAARMGAICETRGVRLIFVNDIEQKFQRSVRFFEDGDVHLVSLREEPLECPFNRVVKRILDIAISLPVVVFILPPVTLLVYLIHRAQSPGPLFFKQKRTGFQFAPFEIIKFRTMHVFNPDESAQATAEDPRVFSMGRWLRKLSVDELPQFINVLLADMSIVGPRPHMVEHDDRFQKAATSYRVRSLVRPGITGLAQVEGFRGETRQAADVIGRVRSDVYYLENWTFGMDWSIIFRTGWQLLRPPKSAY
jgi:exopolysaccharide biosynthesis polyprenyl glycosylphosphotransferase